MLQDETLRSFNFFIGAGSVKVSVCPEYPVLTSVFCSTARPSSTLSCSASWRGASHGWPSSCISGSAPGSGSSLVPPVSPPTYTDNLQHWSGQTPLGPVSTIIFGNKETFSYCCVQAAAGATADPPRTRTSAWRGLSTTGWRPATRRGRLSTARAPPAQTAARATGAWRRAASELPQYVFFKEVVRRISDIETKPR